MSSTRSSHRRHHGYLATNLRHNLLFSGCIVSTVLSNDQPPIKRRFCALRRCITTTRWSKGETLLVVAQGGGGYEAIQQQNRET